MNLVLMPTQSFLIGDVALLPKAEPHTNPEVNLRVYFDLASAKGTTLPLSAALPLAPDHTFVLYTSIVILTIHANIPMGIMNRTSWQQQSSPVSPLLALDRSEWDANQLVPWTGAEAAWVDVVLNNLDEHGHPFHLVSSYLFHPIFHCGSNRFD